MYDFLYNVEHRKTNNLQTFKKLQWKSVSVVLDPTEFHCMNKYSLNILQNVFFCVLKKKEINTEIHNTISLW